MQVVVDTILTHYVQVGSGTKTVVILHGWADASASFTPLIQHLSQTYTVIAIDLPGFGGSALPPGTWNLDNYVLFISHFLAKIDAPAIWAYIGHSNGGAMAIRGLGTGALTAERLVLLASAGIRGVHGRRNQWLKVLTKTGKVASSPLPARMRKQLRAKLYKTVGSDMLVAEQLQETFKKIVADDVRNDAVGIAVPTLLIYGEQDQDAPVWYGEEFHELITDSTLQILPGAGHFVHLDRPEVVEASVETFLK